MTITQKIFFYKNVINLLTMNSDYQQNGLQKSDKTLCFKGKTEKSYYIDETESNNTLDKPAHDLEPVKHFKNKMSHRFHCFVVANPPIN